MAIYLGNKKVAVNRIINVGTLIPEKLVIDQNGTYTAPAGTAYTPVEVNISGMNLNAIAIRPDAQLIKTFTADQMAGADLNKNVRATGYSTSNVNIITAGATLDNTEYAYDSTNYDYFVAIRTLTIPQYGDIGVGKGMTDQAWCVAGYSFFQPPSGQYNYRSAQTGWGYSNTAIQVIGYAAYKTLYWNSETALALTTDATYGIIQIPTAPLISNNKIRIRNPVMRWRGNTSLFSETYYNFLNDIRVQYVIEIYRAPKNNLNINGWGLEEQFSRLIHATTQTNDLKLT